MEPKDFRNYFGFNKAITYRPSPPFGSTQIQEEIFLPNSFGCLSSVSHYRERMIFFYDWWRDGVSFNLWENPIPELAKYYSVDGEEYLQMRSAQPNLFTLLWGKYIEFAQAIGNEEFQQAFISPRKWEMYVEFTEDKIFERKGIQYNEIIQANLPFATALIQIAHQKAFARDPEFWSDASLVLPE